MSDRLSIYQYYICLCQSNGCQAFCSVIPPTIYLPSISLSIYASLNSQSIHPSIHPSFLHFSYHSIISSAITLSLIYSLMLSIHPIFTCTWIGLLNNINIIINSLFFYSSLYLSARLDIYTLIPIFHLFDIIFLFVEQFHMKNTPTKLKSKHSDQCWLLLFVLQKIQCTRCSSTTPET